MKKLVTIISLLAIVAFLGACGFSADTLRYSRGNWDGEQYHEMTTEECPSLVVKINFIEQVMFDWDQDVIRDDQQPVIDKVAALMKKHDYLNLSIRGWASVEGTDEYNLDLSQRRADSSKAALVAKGVEANRIETSVGRGETDLFGAKDDLKSNRTVFILGN